jgi:hypothetical protein
MNPVIPLRKTASILVVVAALVSVAQAVFPPPDGGYPGLNTAEGQNALLSLDTSIGLANTAVGWFSLKSNVGASFNTGIGAGTLLLNTADENTAVGAAALLLNTAGESNTAVGVTALLNNATGSGNSAFGWGALAANTADANTAVGLNALLNNTTGGTIENIQGFDLGPNVAVGAGALRDNTIASANTAVGFQALRNFTTGPAGFGPVGLCTAVGFQALANDMEGAGNTGFGYQALFSNSGGTDNTAIGLRALYENTSGSFNVAVGTDALGSNTQGSGNIALGVGAGNGVTTGVNIICIGGNVGADVSNSCYIGNIFGQPGGSQAVYVNSDGKLGAQVSSRRFKEKIKPMDNVSEALFSLKPVTFQYKKEIDPASKSQFGLVAEEVENVNPDLVVCDKDGKPYTVRYDQVNAMLLNEFLKEHKKVEEQQASIAQLKSHAPKCEAKIAELKSVVIQQQKAMETLTAQLKEQAAQIQEVSAQLRVSKRAASLVLNSH